MVIRFVGRAEDIFDDKRFSDIVIHIVGEADGANKRKRATPFHVIRASRGLLAFHSPYFRTRIRNWLQDQDSMHVEVRDQHEADMLRKVLHFMCADQLDDTDVRSSQALLAILKCADQYDVPRCVRATVRELARHTLSLEEAFVLLELDHHECVADIYPGCYTVVVPVFQDLEAVMQSAELCAQWRRLPLKAVQAVQRSDLHVSGQETIVDALSEWMRAQHRTHLAAQLAPLVNWY